jgi:hypothetical protein
MAPNSYHNEASGQAARPTWCPFSMPFAVRSFAAALVLVAACASGEGASNRADGPRRPLYKPGQSLAARLCACRECFDAACCDGEPSASDEVKEGDFGIAVSACGRCVRRTWTVRGQASCASNAPDTCCRDSVTE